MKRLAMAMRWGNDGWSDDRDTCIAWHNDLVTCVSGLSKGMIRSSRYRIGM